jgi:trimeric autotransporter adhesin
MRLKWLFLSCLLGAPLALAQQPPAPVLFFSDLTSGPATGNSDTTYASSGGAYVTLYGNYLSNFTSVKLNGASCLTVISQPATWMWYQRMVVMIGPTCTTGNFSITTAGGTWSGPTVETSNQGGTADFTVRSGHIWYVTVTGSIKNSGTFQSPFGDAVSDGISTNGAGARAARNAMSDGDITYLENGYDDYTDDGQSWGAVWTMRSPWCPTTESAAQTTPWAVVAYPGATATMGNIASGGDAGFVQADANICFGGYVIAELTLRGGDSVWEGGAGGTYYQYAYRLVGNDDSSPNTGLGAETGMVNGADIVGFHELGDNLHNAATNDSPTQVGDLYHAWYFGDVHGGEFGWNTIAYVYGCRGMQNYYTNPSDSQHDYNWLIHDNIVHDTACDGIFSSQFDPSKGYVRVYNNVVYNAGQGPVQVGGGGNFACLYFPGYNSDGGTMYVYNNTLYNCGSIGNSQPDGFGAIMGGDGCPCSGMTAELHNNVVYESNSASNGVGTGYLSDNSPDANYFLGSNNNWYSSWTSVTPSAGGVTSNLTTNLNTNPDFVTPGSNFQLTSSSPMIGAGVTSSPAATYDQNGLVRPSPPAIGAYEISSGSSGGGAPNPPTDLTVVVSSS